MAGGYGCADDDCTVPVNWLITHLRPPLTLSMCDEHFAPFIIPVLAADLGVDADRLYDVIKRHVDKEAKRQAAEAATAEAAEAAQVEAADASEAAEDQLEAAALAAESMADIIPEDWRGEAMT